MLTIFNKELKSYFTSAIGYVFMGIFLFLSGIFFVLTNLVQGNSEYNLVLEDITFTFLLLVPILTMRTLSEERKNKTDQLLLTSAISVWDIVMGKFLSACTLFLITLCVTTIYPIILKIYGTIAVGEILCGYIGFFLMGCALISIGIFISSLTENQVVSAALSFGVLLALWISDWIKQSFSNTLRSGLIFSIVIAALITLAIYYAVKNIYVTFLTGAAGAFIIGIVYFTNKSLYEGFIQNFFGWFSLLSRYDMFANGILSLNSIIYYLSFAFIFLFLTVRMIEKRRWS